jgi:hypothetical protein
MEIRSPGDDYRMLTGGFPYSGMESSFALSGNPEEIKEKVEVARGLLMSVPVAGSETARVGGTKT